MTASKDPSVGMVIADRYILLERIAEGSTGPVYRADHAILRHRLAVKLVHEHLSRDEQATESCHEQVAQTARIESEHVVKVIDFGRTDHGQIFVAMEYLEGETLADVLIRERKLALPRVLEIFGQLGDALSEAHAMGITHGNLRPTKVLITRRKGRVQVKVLGLGMSPLVASTAAAALVAGDGLGLLDPYFVSPEQIRGEALDARADVYSLGALAYTMLAGRPPFVGESANELIQQHLQADPPPLSADAGALPAHAVAAVMQALSKRPEERFPTVVRLIAALRGTMTGQQQRSVAAEAQAVVVDTPAKEAAVAANAGAVAAKAPASAETQSEVPSEPAATEPAATEPAATEQQADVAGKPADPAPQAVPAEGVAVPAEGAVQETADDETGPSVPVDEKEASSPTPAEAVMPSTTTKGSGAAETAATVGSAAPAGDAAEDDAELAVDRLSSETGEWFAHGLAAEEALGSATSSSSLPALYGRLDDLELHRRGLSPSVIISAVVGGAVLLLVIVVMLVRGSAEEPSPAATKRVTPAQSSALVTTNAGAAITPTKRPAAAAVPEKKADDTAADRPAAGDTAVQGAAAAPGAPESQDTEQASEPTPSPPKAKVVPAPPAPREKRPSKAAAPRRADPPRLRNQDSSRGKKERRREHAASSAARGSDARQIASREIADGRAQLRRGAYAEARGHFRRALRADSASAEAHSGLGEVEFELGNYAAAEKNFRLALRSQPNQARYLVMLGNACFKQGKTSQSVLHYRKALTIAPNSVGARNGLEAAIRRMGGSN